MRAGSCLCNLFPTTFNEFYSIFSMPPACKPPETRYASGGFLMPGGIRAFLLAAFPSSPGSRHFPRPLGPHGREACRIRRSPRPIKPGSRAKAWGSEDIRAFLGRAGREGSRRRAARALSCDFGAAGSADACRSAPIPFTPSILYAVKATRTALVPCRA